DNEDRQSDRTPVARRWLGLYGQLAAATQAMVDEAMSAAEGLQEPARAAFEEAYVRPLDGRLAQLQRGLDHWRHRHSALMDLDLDAGELRHAGKTVRVSHRERQLLDFLLGHPGSPFTATALLLQAWHSSYLAEEQLRTYMVRIRRKLASV